MRNQKKRIDSWWPHDKGWWFSPPTHHPFSPSFITAVCNSSQLLSDWIKYVSGTNRPLCYLRGQPCHMSAAISGTCLSAETHQNRPVLTVWTCCCLLRRVRGHGGWWHVFSPYSVVCGFTSFYGCGKADVSGFNESSFGWSVLSLKLVSELHQRRCRNFSDIYYNRSSPHLHSDTMGVFHQVQTGIMRSV